MPNPSGSSCVGINFSLQAHLVLEESYVGRRRENVLGSSCEYFSRHECPDLLLCGDVLCKQDFWREEMVGVTQLTNHSLLRTHRQTDLAGGFSVLGMKLRTGATTVRCLPTVGWERFH
jgi:hypothetical protein